MMIVMRGYDCKISVYRCHLHSMQGRIWLAMCLFVRPNS